MSRLGIKKASLNYVRKAYIKSYNVKFYTPLSLLLGNDQEINNAENE